MFYRYNSLLQATETWTKLANSMRDSVFWAHSEDAKVLKALGVKPKSITMVCIACILYGYNVFI